MLKDRVRRPSIIGRLAMGRPAAKGSKRPEQLDHFEVTTTEQDANGVFIVDKAFYQAVGLAPGAKGLREVEFFVDSDNLEDFMSQSYQTRIKTRRGLSVFCEGDGERAQRLQRDGTLKSVVCRSAPPRPGNGVVEPNPRELAEAMKAPWDDAPGAKEGKRCPFATNTNPQDGPCCKPTTELLVRLTALPTVAGFYRFRSHGHRTADAIVQSLMTIRDLVGSLRFVPLKLVLTRQRLQRPGGGYGIHSVAHVELAQKPEQALMMAARRESGINRGLVGVQQARALLEAPATQADLEVEDAEWQDAAEVGEIEAELLDDEKPGGSMTVPAELDGYFSDDS